MKSFFLVCMALFSLSSNVQAFYVEANCYVQSGARAVCEVCNHQGSPMLCEIRSRGLTSRGAWINNRGRGVIQAGQCATTWVQANNPYIDPLVDASASANCRF